MILVTGIHGDENVPVLALASLGIPQLVANPRALALHQRYIEKDLNQSFGSAGKTYEEKRAVQILATIPPSEVIVDLHTMSADSDPFAIVVDRNQIPLAAQTGVRHIVLMSYNIKNGHALINHRAGISVELGQHASWEAFQEVKRVRKNLIAGKLFHPAIYEVYGKIENPGNYRNFVKHTDGFIPVLAGEKAYDFFGLKARRLKSPTLP